jgi:pyruvate dehydrogenase E1 component
VHATTVPAVRAYDVAFAFELAAIVEDGMKRMFEDEENVWYYLTLQNENYPMPAMPEGAKEGILRGLYRFRPAKQKLGKHVQLWGSGSIMLQVLRAQELLERHGVSADVWGVTSYQRLRTDALECERDNRLHPEAPPRVPYISEVLKGVEGPFITASDYMKTMGDLVARWIPGRFVPLGTDGFGMSDTREALRRHFEVDAESIVIGALDALRLEGKVTNAELAKAIRELGVNPDKVPPLSV